MLPVDQTWLSLMLKERARPGITGSCNYKGELLDGAMVGVWMEDLIALLGAAMTQPNTPHRQAARPPGGVTPARERGFTRQSCA